MFQTLYSAPATCRRHSDGPFADERDRYLRHCADFGATRGTLRHKGNELLWFAHHLGSQATDGVDLEKLQEIAFERQSICKGRTAGQRLINIARPWLRFLGWWHVPVIEIRFQNQLDQFVAWMRDERGLSPSTIERWRAQVGVFLHWCDRTNRHLLTLRSDEIDDYFVSCGPGRWSRVSVSHIASALRVFLRFTGRRVDATHTLRRQSGDLVYINRSRYHTPHSGLTSGGSWRTPRPASPAISVIARS